MTALLLDNAPLWTGLGLVAPLLARVSGGVPVGVHGISIDTRTLQAGDLFFAIKGEKSDGHDHVAKAMANGAAAAVVDESHNDALAGHPAIWDSSVLAYRWGFFDVA